MGFLALFLLSSTIGFANNSVDVRVDYITDPMIICHCENPGQLGRICISIHKWNALEGYNMVSEELATKFIPSIDNNSFILLSEAFYQRCQYGLSPNIFTDPVRQAEANSIGPYFDHVGYLGKDPLMKATVLDPKGNTLAYSDFVAGKFGYKEFFFSLGTRDEAHRILYPGHTSITFPIEKILTLDQIKDILLNNKKEFRTVKSILAVRTKEGATRAFGEYTITLRFFRKQEATLAQVKENPLNTSLIGVGVENVK